MRSLTSNSNGLTFLVFFILTVSLTLAYTSQSHTTPTFKAIKRVRGPKTEKYKSLLAAAGLDGFGNHQDVIGDEGSSGIVKALDSTHEAATPHSTGMRPKAETLTSKGFSTLASVNNTTEVLQPLNVSKDNSTAFQGHKAEGVSTPAMPNPITKGTRRGSSRKSKGPSTSKKGKDKAMKHIKRSRSVNPTFWG
ncbi:hypothetical protein BT69DRAFT_1371885 [Atractiella rhizophila]|nr:hypothetical protein BT69DRAFT_1371885 [Atractiella rhizophila]